MPYLIDGNVKFTQSKAIMKYIARKHNLIGRTEEERIRIDVIEGVSDDFRTGFAQLCYNPNFVSNIFNTREIWDAMNECKTNMYLSVSILMRSIKHNIY